MPEQQLVDYIKKAKDAGQNDTQTKSLLLKNGWTEPEINEAFASLVQPQSQPQARPQPQPQTQPKPQPQVQPQPSIQAQADAFQTKTATQPQTVVGQTQYKPQTVTASSSMRARKPGSGMLVRILLILIIVIALAGGGLFVAGKYFNFPWNPFSVSPESVLKNMMARMKEVKSNKSVIAGDLSVSSGGIEQGKITFAFNGDGDMNDPNNIVGNSSLVITANSAADSTPISTIDASAKISGKVLYLKIDELLLPGMPPIPGLDINKIKGQWYKLDEESIKALSAQSGEQMTFDFSQIQGSDLSNKVQDLILSENVFAVSQTLPDELIDGQNTYHYLVKISKDSLKNIFGKIVDMQMEEVAKVQAGTDLTMATNVAKTIASSFIDKLGDIDLELWIGKSNFLLYRAKMNKTIDVSSLMSGLGVSLPETDMSIAVNFSIDNSAFGEPVTVQEPEGSKKIEELLIPLLKNQQIGSNLNSISAVAIGLSAKNKSYASLCYRGLLNGYEKTYGKDLGQYATNMMALGAKNPNCFANADNYCVSTQLQDNTSMCVGINGVTGTTKCISAQTVCQ